MNVRCGKDLQTRHSWTSESLGPERLVSPVPRRKTPLTAPDTRGRCFEPTHIPDTDAPPGKGVSAG